MDIRQNTFLASFIRHPNAANLLMVLMLLFGVFGLMRLNTQFFPTVEQPNITVSIAWPGASANDVEGAILAIVEPEIRFIDGAKELRSTAREGGAYVNLEFEEGTDMQKAMSDVENAVAAISTLPEAAEAPTVTRSTFFDAVASMSISGDVPEETLRRWAKRMRDDMIAAGIDKVSMSGMRAEEIAVTLSPTALRRHNLTVAEVARAIGANATDVPSGSLEGGVERQLRVLAATDDLQQLRTIEIRTRATGERLLLGDIATLARVYDQDAIQGFSDGARAIELEVSRAPTADTLEVAGIFRDYVEEVRQQLPEGITLQVYDVRADQLAERIWLLIENGTSGMLVVILILYLFLDRRIAFWIVMGVPIATMATFGVLLLLGESINMFSLFGLIMMLGVIVDDAIVIGEHTATRIEMGDTGIEAAENALSVMSVPVIAAMATTLASFFPMMLITGTIGQIMGVLPVVVVAVVIVSLIETLLILPAHLAHALSAPPARPRWSHWLQFAIAAGLCVAFALAVRFAPGQGMLADAAGWLRNLGTLQQAGIIALCAYAASASIEALRVAWLKRKSVGPEPATRSPGHGARQDAFRRGFDRRYFAFRDGPYRRAVVLTYRWRYVTLATAIALMLTVGVGLVRSGEVRFAFFPSPEAERVFGRLTLHPGTPQGEVRAALAETEAALREAAARLSPDAALVSATFARIGSAGRERGENFAEVIVQLVPTEQRTVRTPELTRAWRDAMPKRASIQRFSVTEARGGPPGRDIDIQLSGPDSATLKAAGADLILRLGEINGVSGLNDDLPYGKPELILELTPRGGALGFSIEEVGRQVRNGLEGVVARRFAKGDEEIAVRVGQETGAEGFASLRRMELRTPAGAFVPLSEIVTITERQGFAKIERLNGKAKLSVTGDIDAALNTTDGVIQELQASGALETVAATHGVEFSFGGRAQEQRAAFADVGIGSILALFMIFIVLAWSFGSYLLPLAVMIVIPFGYVGAVFGHWLMGFDLTILSLISLLGLAGIMVNESIVLVSAFDERRSAGEPLDDAAIGASTDRLRAILLTSITTLGGLAPMLFEKSLQAQFLMPMVISMFFGLAFSTLLVLLLVPAILGIGRDIGTFFGWIYGRRRGGIAAQPAE